MYIADVTSNQLGRAQSSGLRDLLLVVSLPMFGLPWSIPTWIYPWIPWESLRGPNGRFGIRLIKNTQVEFFRWESQKKNVTGSSSRTWESLSLDWVPKNGRLPKGFPVSQTSMGFHRISQWLANILAIELEPGISSKCTRIKRRIFEHAMFDDAGAGYCNQ